MPAELTLRLEPLPIVPSPRQLHGAAAALGETPGSEHHQAVKPFSAGPVDRAGDGAAWRLGWLADDGMPPGWPPRSVRFGACERMVVGFGVELWPFARLAATGAARSARVETRSPMFFSRGGRDIPLPDPWLVVRTLATRWNAHAPEPFAIDADAARALSDAVYLESMRGHTETTTVDEARRPVGFVGRFDLRLHRSANRPTAETFGALMGFAAIAGIGAQTTHGFGAVTVTTGGDREPPGRPAEQSAPADSSS